MQLLFADASTGARSPAMVRQGQIGEIIAAKPAARRLVLEEAAGVAGLHSRRHEAELRLEGGRGKPRPRRGRAQAGRCAGRKPAPAGAAEPALSRPRRRNPPLRGAGETDRLARGRGGLRARRSRRIDGLTGDVAERTRLQAETRHARRRWRPPTCPRLRDAEARAGAALHRLIAARDVLAGEEKRAEARAAELRRRIEQMGRDIEREQSLVADAAGVDRAARRRGRRRSTAKDDAATRAPRPTRARPKPPKRWRKPSRRSPPRKPPPPISPRGATRSGAALDEEIRRWRRFEDELAALKRDRAALPGADADESAFEDAAAALEELMETLAEAEARGARGRGGARRRARSRGARSRAPRRGRAPGAAAGDGGAHARKAAGFGARGRISAGARRDRRRARLRDGARRGARRRPRRLHRRGRAGPLGRRGGRRTMRRCPKASKSLAAYIQAPPQLAARLAQIGVVDRAAGPALAARLQARAAAGVARGRPMALGRFRRRRRGADPGRAAAGRKEPARRSAGARRSGAARGRDAEGTRPSRLAAALREAAGAETRRAPARPRGARRRRGARAKSFPSPNAGATQTRTKLAALDEGIARATAARDEAVERRNAAGAAMQALPSGDALAADLERARAAASRGSRASRGGEGVRAQSRARAGIARRATARDRRGARLLGAAARRRRRPISARFPSGAAALRWNSKNSTTRRPSSSCSAARCCRSSARRKRRARAAADERAAAENAAQRGRPRRPRRARGDESSSREQRAAAEQRVEAARRAPRGTAQGDRRRAGDRSAWPARSSPASSATRRRRTPTSSRSGWKT